MTDIDISPVTDERLAELVSLTGYHATRMYSDELESVFRELQVARLALTASESRVAELVAKYETEDPVKPTVHELETWRGNEPIAAVRMYRARLNCGLRQAVAALKGANGER